MLADQETLRRLQYDKVELEQQIVPILKNSTGGVVQHFPGANSVSFRYRHLQMLNVRKTLVCEKTDGVRFFLVEVTQKQTADTIWLLVDRSYNVREVSHRFDLPPHSVPQASGGPPTMQFAIRNIYDGELVRDNHVADSAWAKEHPCPIFLVFDALLVNGSSVMSRPFSHRLTDADSYLKQRFGLARLIKSCPPQKEGVGQIDIFLKEMFHVWDAHALLNKVLPRLEHENDGLIFTVDHVPYYMGTCKHIWKWKPLHLNTIDFVAKPLQLADTSSPPLIWSLHVSQGNLFDFLALDQAKATELLSQLNLNPSAQIVLECNWDPAQSSDALGLIKQAQDSAGLFEPDESDDEASEGQIKKNLFAKRQLRAKKLEEALRFLQAGQALALSDVDLEGGWAVLRQRTDKGANAMQTAESIMQTIRDPVTEDELKVLLEELTPQQFAASQGDPEASTGRRTREQAGQATAQDGTAGQPAQGQLQDDDGDDYGDLDDFDEAF